MRRVHFIYLGGPFSWQNWRAIETARVHDANETVVWCAEPLETEPFSYPVHTRKLQVPEWIKNHPVRLANVKDLYLWKIMRRNPYVVAGLRRAGFRGGWL